MANDITLKSKSGVSKYPKTYTRNILDKDTYLQEKLVSGANIKTVGGQSILGSGDIGVSEIPACPTTTDGNFTLKATVANGVVTYSWIVDTTVSTTEES